MDEREETYRDRLAYHHHGDDTMARFTPVVTPAAGLPHPFRDGWLAEREEQPLGEHACTQDSHQLPFSYQALLSAAL